MDSSWRAVGMAALFFSVAPVSIFAALADDADTCVKGSGDEKIAACTAAIESANGKAVISPGPIPTGDVRITRRRTTPTRSPTRLRRSGSIPKAPTPTSVAAGRMTGKRTTPTRSPARLRRSGSIPKTPTPTSIAAGRMTTQTNSTAPSPTKPRRSS